jgi:Uma2 family endonuclease
MISALDPSIRRYRLSVADVQQMLELGIFDADPPVELLAGELVTTTSQGPEHAAALELLGDRLRGAIAPELHVREQRPLVCGEDSQPEPDLAVVRGTIAERGPPRGHEAVLVVEIAWTTQTLARTKAMIYAHAGITEYWLIDLRARTATIHREIDDGDYASIERIDETQSLTLPDGSTCPLYELLP